MELRRGFLKQDLSLILSLELMPLFLRARRLCESTRQAFFYKNFAVTLSFVLFNPSTLH